MKLITEALAPVRLVLPLVPPSVLANPADSSKVKARICSDLMNTKTKHSLELGCTYSREENAVELSFAGFEAHFAKYCQNFGYLEVYDQTDQSRLLRLLSIADETKEKAKIKILFDKNEDIFK